MGRKELYQDMRLLDRRKSCLAKAETVRVISTRNEILAMALAHLMPQASDKEFAAVVRRMEELRQMTLKIQALSRDLVEELGLAAGRPVRLETKT